MPDSTRKRLGRRLEALLLIGALVAPSVTLALDTRALGCTPFPVERAIDTKSIPFGKGLLFRVRTPAGAVSHVFGTIHVDAPAVTALAPPVEAAFAGAARVVLEAELDPAAMAESALRMFQGTESGLRGQLSAPLYEAVIALLAGHGIDEASANLFKPWAVFMTLSVPPNMSTAPLDLQLMLRAGERGQQVHGLETLSEQLEIFDRLSEVEQVALLKDAVCHYDYVQRQLVRLIDLYVARDLGAVTAIAEQPAGDPVLQAKLMEALLYERNVRMANRMTTHLDAGGAFVAIGALHLPGERGVLALLERSGHRIERVY